MNIPEQTIETVVCFPQLDTINCSYDFIDLLRKLFIIFIVVDIIFIIPQIVALIKLSIYKKKLSKFDIIPPISTLFGLLYKSLMLLDSDDESFLRIVKCLLYCYNITIIQIALWHWKIKNFSANKYNRVFEKVLVSILTVATLITSFSVLTSYYTLIFRIWIGINCGYWIISTIYILIIYYKYKNERRIHIGIVTIMICIFMITSQIFIFIIFNQIENGHEITWLNYYLVSNIIFIVATLGMLLNRIILSSEQNSIENSLYRTNNI